MNRRLQRLFDEHGEGGLVWEVLDEVPDEALVAAEIAAYETLKPDVNILAPSPVVPPMRFRRHSAESCAKMSAAKRAMTIETKAKMSRAQKGRKQTPGQIAARVRGLMGRVVSPETREKISAAQRGKPRPKDSEETRLRKSSGVKQAWADLAKRAAIMRGRKR